MSIHCLSDRCLLRCGSQYVFQDAGGGLIPEEKKETAVFVSRIYDSGREGTEWNHIRLDVARTAVLELYVWLFDRIDEEEEAFLRTNVAEWFERRKNSAQYYSDYRNMLLYGKGCGRYARIAVKILQGSEKNAMFRGYDLSFPKESFTEYLPGIYRDNPQLDRFLAVHQNIYLGLEEDIESWAKKLDYELCTKNQAVRLARWLGWGELSRQVEEDVLRELLRRGISLANRKGTCAYYTELTKILTGEDAAVIEEPDKCRAVVLIWNRPKQGREKCLEWLKRNVPIGIDIDFVILGKTDRLNEKFFLDKTSYLSEYESVLAAEGCPVDGLQLL